MTIRTAIGRWVMQEDLNFLLTNRLPRRLATRFMGWFARLEQPVIRDLSMLVWRWFSDIDLADAETKRFRSLHDCFTRRLRAGTRPIDPDPRCLVSPCDAIIGACGRIDGDRVLQIKGSPYTLSELLGGTVDLAPYRDGVFVTLRLTAAMYHHFHAPSDLAVEAVSYLSGDTWNVNPIALKRLEKLFCRNERAAIVTRLAPSGVPLLLVPVAAILVAGIRLRFVDTPGLLRDGGPRVIRCARTFAKGEEMGWFEHGSTILVFAPPGISLGQGVSDGTSIRVGQALLRIGPQRVDPIRSSGQVP